MPRDLTLHEPLMLDFVLTNNSTASVELDLGKDRKEAFQFVVVRPDGSDVTLRPHRSEGIGEGGNVTLAAGAQYEQQLLFNEWFTFSAPGTYEIQVKLAHPIRGLATGTFKDPARLTVDVLPRNEQRLAETCTALKDKIETSKSYAEASAAAEALSHIDDSIVIPYIESSIGATHNVDLILIRGLERMGNDVAVRSLINVYESRKGESAAIARNALVRLASNTSDGTLKVLIKTALDK
jgi:hypothetical protein